MERAAEIWQTLTFPLLGHRQISAAAKICLSSSLVLRLPSFCFEKEFEAKTLLLETNHE